MRETSFSPSSDIPRTDDYLIPSRQLRCKLLLKDKNTSQVRRSVPLLPRKHFLTHGPPDKGPRQTTPPPTTTAHVRRDYGSGDWWRQRSYPRSPAPAATENSRVFVVNNNNGIPNNVYGTRYYYYYYHHHDVRTLKYSEISLNQGRG